MSEMYDADYYLRGRESGKSLYQDYRWMPELTVPMCQRIAEHLGMSIDDVVLDFGCARGYTVKAFRELGVEAYGVDVSEWAIANADEAVAPYLKLGSALPPNVDWVIAKDVLEHVLCAADTITALMDAAKIGVFAVVPLSAVDGGPYIVPDYELDVTHVHRLTLASWVRFFIRHGWSVECRYRVRGVKDNYHGWLTWIKDNYELWRNGNGFITARRL